MCVCVCACVCVCVFQDFGLLQTFHKFGSNITLSEECRLVSLHRSGEGERRVKKILWK